MSDKFYLTTAIYYANAAPHIGHAYEIIGADVIARFQKLIGKDVFFLTGTDEHGIKVEKTAAKHDKTPQAYVDDIAEKFKTSWRNTLNVDYTRFIRTTDAEHKAAVSALWKKLLAQDDIYKHTYTGLYCAGCETFMNERDLTEDGLCPNHQTAPEPVEEENYFFRLTKYKERIVDYINGHPEFIQPAFRKTEIMNQLEDLVDISVSRATRSVTWGIPVPDDPDQVIYVWIDALSNYLTGAGWNSDDAQFKKLWTPEVQVIGKDILKFHAIYWPALLMAADIEIPKTLLVHGFINVADTKISKSLGNVISSEDLIERFQLDNADPIRYYMMTSTGFGQDGSYTDDEFKNKINADLANNLGNLLNRTLNMLNKYFDGQVPTPDSNVRQIATPQAQQDIFDKYNEYSFNEALDAVMGLVDQANKTVNDAEPWTLHKEGKIQELGNVLYSILETLRQVAIMLSPVVPSLSQNIWEQLGYTTPLQAVRWNALKDAPLPAGQATALGSPILPRLDSEIVGAGKKK